MNNPLTTRRPVMRLFAVMLVVVIAGTLAAPARAEAVDFFLVSAAVSAAIVILIVIVFLVIANTKGSKMDDSKGPEPIKIACVESETQPRTCWAVDNPEQTVSWDSVVVVSQLQPQS
jgi:heme/copper-type cytochrome/quinol oxidase subunit 2